MPSDPKEVYRLIAEIRKAFNDLKAYSDSSNGDLDITAAMRAVMETLDGQGPMPVPEIARTKNVTRQHIQQLADALVEAGLARFVANPAHKSSRLLTLTRMGMDAFADIRQREAVALKNIARALDGDDLTTTIATIGHLREKLAGLPSP